MIYWTVTHWVSPWGRPQRWYVKEARASAQERRKIIELIQKCLRMFKPVAKRDPGSQISIDLDNYFSISGLISIGARSWIKTINTDNQEVWPPGSADTVCSRPPLMTQVQHLVSRSVSCIVWEIANYWSKFAKFFIPHLYLAHPQGGGNPGGILRLRLMLIKLEWFGYRVAKKLRQDVKPFP